MEICKQLKHMIINTTKSVEKHSSEILIGIGVSGMIVSTVLAVKATPKAIELIEKREDELETTGLTFKEKAKTSWKCYIPATVTCTVSAACILGASSIHLKRNAALATAYSFSEKALTEYRRKVIDTIGEAKEETIRESIDKDHLKENKSSNNEIIITGSGETLCYDYFSDRYFKSNVEKLRRIENELCKEMLKEGFVSLSEYYYQIGLKPRKGDDDIGWDANKDYMEFRFGAQLTPEEEPCIVVSFNIQPESCCY